MSVADAFEHRPARRYTWRDAWPGNDLALKHGAHSPANREPLEADLLNWARHTAPHLAAPEHEAALRAWARCESMVLLLQEFVDGQPSFVDDDGRPIAVLGQLDRYERSALRHREQLGLDPRSRLSLLRDLADLARLDGAGDLAGVAAEGRAALERRASLEAGDTSVGAGGGEL